MFSSFIHGADEGRRVDEAARPSVSTMIAAAVGDGDTDEYGDAEMPLGRAIFLRLQERGCSPSPPQSDGGGGFHARVSRQTPSKQTPPLVPLVPTVPLVVAASAGARRRNEEAEAEEGEEEEAEVDSALVWADDDDDAVEAKLELLKGLPFMLVLLPPRLGWVELVATSPVSSPPGRSASEVVPLVGGRNEEGGGVLGAPALASLLLLLPFSFRAVESPEESLPLWYSITSAGVHILLDSGEDMGDSLLAPRLGEDDGEREGER